MDARSILVKLRDGVPVEPAEIAWFAARPRLGRGQPTARPAPSPWRSASAGSARPAGWR